MIIKQTKARRIWTACCCPSWTLHLFDWIKITRYHVLFYFHGIRNYWYSPFIRSRRNATNIFSLSAFSMHNAQCTRINYTFLLVNNSNHFFSHLTDQIYYFIKYICKTKTTSDSVFGTLYGFIENRSNSSNLFTHQTDKHDEFSKYHLLLGLRRIPKRRNQKQAQN